MTSSWRLRLETQLDALDEILAGATAADLERRPPSGKWSAREQLAHLARYHEVFLERLRRMLREEAPSLGRYRAEEDPGFAPWLDLPAADVLARLRALRGELAAAVAPLGPEQLTRTGVHPAFGPMSLALWLEFFLAHEGHHLYVIFQRVRERG